MLTGHCRDEVEGALDLSVITLLEEFGDFSTCQPQDFIFLMKKLKCACIVNSDSEYPIVCSIWIYHCFMIFLDLH